MKRTGSLTRYTRLRSRTRIKARNAKRYAKNWARAYGSSERAAWVRSLPCIITGQTPSENAHIETGGMGRKADASLVVPLCKREHERLHRWGRETFERFHGVSLDMYAAETESLWKRMGGA